MNSEGWDGRKKNEGKSQEEAGRKQDEKTGKDERRRGKGQKTKRDERGPERSERATSKGQCNGSIITGAGGSKR